MPAGDAGAGACAAGFSPGGIVTLYASLYPSPAEGPDNGIGGMISADVSAGVDTARRIVLLGNLGSLMVDARGTQPQKKACN